jgi:superfamily II DNA or RNA helicase
MANLRDLDFKMKYRSNQDKIYKDFIEPCISVSTHYDRAVGYFTSNSIKLFASGLEKFIDNNGKIRLICNPYLEAPDIEAIAAGIEARDDVIKRRLFEEIEICAKSIEDESLNILAWLVYKEILEIKIAFTDDTSIYHEKFGIFTDSNGYKVLFSGSSNETRGGLSSNFEKIDVFTESMDLFRVNDAVSDFEQLWSNQTVGLNVIEFYNELKDYLLSQRKPEGISKISKINLPYEIREYQTQAIQSLEQNGWRGIFEMATGTGKTKTSLIASQKYRDMNKKIFLVILVPFTHLVEQWKLECQKFGYKEIIECFGSKKSWLYDLEALVDRYNLGLTDHGVAISVYKSANKQEFISSIKSIKNHIFLVADECHYFGTSTYQHDMFDFIEARLGLSATPQRWWDPVGSEHIFSYFGKTVFEYTIEQAIENKALCQYLYYPIIVSLNEDELDEYVKLTEKMAHYIDSKKKEDQEILKQLTIKRKLIIKRCSMKKDVLYEMLRSIPENERSHILVYCAPAEIVDVTSSINDLGYRVSRFDHELKTSERNEILGRFDSGEIEVLVAIKCLDEGVDVPSTKTAYFLASTSNPKEFIQRRGRVLRNSKNKVYAKIYDFIVMSSVSSDEILWDIAKKELPRFAEFADNATNKYIAREEVWKLLREHNLEYLMDKKSWEIYHEDRNERKFDYAD